MNRGKLMSILVLLWVSAITLHAADLSFEQSRVTVKQNDATLSDVLWEIHKQTSFTFMYSTDDIKSVKVGSITLDNASLEEALEVCLTPNGLMYSVNGDVITISKAPAKKSSPKETKVVSVSQPQEQVIQVVGTVIAESDRLPIIGATVYQKDNMSNGVVTDLDGNFIISVPTSSKLVIASMGYQTEEVVPAAKLRIILKDEAQLLDAVVFVGYGVQRKESVVGAISQVNNEALVNSGNTNITQAIAGKLSGVLAMQSGGTPGANDATIVIRGVSSWNGSEPLVMVDGVERSFSSIDPNEVETISVLKDASATAVFGAKGANGVILVTTKQGKKGKPKMNLSVSHGLNFAAGLPKHIDAVTTARAYNLALMNQQSFSEIYSEKEIAEFASPSSAINALRYPDVNWYDMLLKDCAHTTDANINISGGGDRARYFISFGYKNEGSLFKTLEGYDTPSYAYDRLNYRANLDFEITKTTQLSLRVGGDIGMRTTPGKTSTTTPITLMYSASTVTFPAIFPSWVIEEIPDLNYPDASGERLSYGVGNNSGDNPYNYITSGSYSKNTVSRLNTDVILDQKLDFITEGLSVKGKFSYSTYLNRISEQATHTRTTYYINWDNYDTGDGNPWQTSGAASNTVIEDAPLKAEQGSISSYTSTMYWEASLNYNRSWKNHHVTGLALFNQREYINKIQFPYRTQGLVGRVTYDYGHKYLIEANVGYTGSEQFAPSNRYGFFPSVAIGYVISEEKFWKRALPWWSKFKLRYSDGLVGNDQTESRWLYYSSYTYDKSLDAIYEDQAPNLNAQWETARKRDLGVEMAWLDDRLTLGVDLFDEYRTNMLVSPNTTLFYGNTAKEVNTGIMKKHGFETELGWSDSFSNGLRYNVNAMFSFNENRIVNYEDPLVTPEYQKVAGKPFQGMTTAAGVVDSGYYTSVDDIHNYVSYTDDWSKLYVGSYKFLDYNVDGKINADDRHAIKGSIYPTTIFSLGGGLSYKGWEFSMLFYGNLGKYVRYTQKEFNGNIRTFAPFTDYWTPTNQDAHTSTPINNSGAGHIMYTWAGTLYLEGRSWVKADYFSLRDVYLGYTFKTKALKARLGISSLNLYLTGNNLFHITTLPEGNPEKTDPFTGYPLYRTVKLGVKIGF